MSRRALIPQFRSLSADYFSASASVPAQATELICPGALRVTRLTGVNASPPLQGLPNGTGHIRQSVTSERLGGGADSWQHDGVGFSSGNGGEV